MTLKQQNKYNLLDARRQLLDKELRYLWTVIVTANVSTQTHTGHKSGKTEEKSTNLIYLIFC